MRRYPKLDDHEDVQLEMREVHEQWKAERWEVPLGLLLSFLMQLVPVTLLVVLTRWWFGAETLIPTVAALAAWVGGSVFLWSALLMQRIKRMEVHALTIHNELLTVRDKVM